MCFDRIAFLSDWDAKIFNGSSWRSSDTVSLLHRSRDDNKNRSRDGDNNRSRDDDNNRSRDDNKNRSRDDDSNRSREDDTNTRERNT